MKMRAMIGISCFLLLFSFLVGCGEEALVPSTTGEAVQTQEVAAAAAAAASIAALSEVTTALPETTATLTAAASSAGKVTAAATKKTQSAAPKMTKWEVDIAGIKVPAANTKLLRAWKASQNGISVEAHRLAVGAPRTVSGTSGSSNKALVQPVVTVAKINASPERLFSKTAQQVFPSRGKATVEEIAQKEGALIAFNNSYFGNAEQPFPTYTVSSPIVRDGKVVSSGGGSQFALNIYEDGRWVREDITPATVDQQLANGLYSSQVDLMVGISGGERAYTWNDVGDEPYLFFGQIDKNNYVVAIGEFLSRDAIVTVMLAYGVQTAFECNGGNHAYLFLDGVGNAPNPTTDGKSLQNLNKLNLLDNEQQYLLGIFAGKGKGGPDTNIDAIYFK
jgi:hypothetical protein